MSEFRFDPDDLSEARNRLSQRPGEPSDETWSACLEQLLGSLAWAGWDLPESYDTDYDAEDGAYLFGELLRTGMVIKVQYQPGKGELLLLPCEDEDFSRLSMLTGSVTISVGRDIDRGAELVAEQAGNLGLLDATRLRAAPDSDLSTAELITDRVVESVIGSAAEYRNLPPEVLVDQVMGDEALSTRHRCRRLAFAKGRSHGQGEHRRDQGCPAAC